MLIIIAALTNPRIVPMIRRNMFTMRTAITPAIVNEQIQNETSYFGNGTIFPFSFIANSTIANGELSLFGQDFENNNSKPHDPISYATF